jgi:2-keto-3-deoxy-L-rhamnonate aldolase RhmA
MNNSNFREILAQRCPCFGSWCQTGSQAAAEILARTGFEWLALDCEHGEAGDQDIASFCRAVSQYDCLPLVRVMENSLMSIRRALDLGARGVIVPLVNTAGEAELAVSAAKYPPVGVRGFAFHRGNNWGADFESGVLSANRETAVIVMIESKEGVENIEKILDVDGVDGVFIGPYDLSGSYGVTGQLDHITVQEACSRVAAACAKTGKAAGMHLVKPERKHILDAMKMGITFMALGMDTVFLSMGARTVLGAMKHD